jgi:hypothetical protein
METKLKKAAKMVEAPAQENVSNDSITASRDEMILTLVNEGQVLKDVLALSEEQLTALYDDVKSAADVLATRKDTFIDDVKSMVAGMDFNSSYQMAALAAAHDVQFGLPVAKGKDIDSRIKMFYPGLTSANNSARMVYSMAVRAINCYTATVV